VSELVPKRGQEAAQCVDGEHRRIELSIRDSVTFVEALLNPQPVNARLRETVRRYRDATRV
jgi:uncharacterized protein (DUF1778 family)